MTAVFGSRKAKFIVWPVKREWERENRHQRESIIALQIRARVSSVPTAHFHRVEGWPIVHTVTDNLHNGNHTLFVAE